MLRTDKAPFCTNTPSNSIRKLVEGFILQLRIEGYSPKTINHCKDYVNNFAVIPIFFRNLQINTKW